MPFCMAETETKLMTFCIMMGLSLCNLYMDDQCNVVLYY